MVNVLPAIVRVPLRAAPVLGRIEYVTVPLPVLLVGLTVIHALLFETVQPHVLAEALTVTLPEVAAPETFALVGLIEKEHVGGGGGAEPMVMLMFLVAVCRVLDESATCTVKLKVPLVVGIPEMTPVLLSVRPEPSEPFVIDHV